jgi:hypothetical protein
MEKTMRTDRTESLWIAHTIEDNNIIAEFEAMGESWDEAVISAMIVEDSLAPRPRPDRLVFFPGCDVLDWELATGQPIRMLFV